MRILAIFGALTLLGCDDSITAVTSKTSTGLNSQRGAEKKKKKSQKNKGKLQPDLPVYTVPQKEPESAEKDKEQSQGKKKSNDRVDIKNGVDLAKARALHEYIKSLVHSDLNPEMCLQAGSKVKIGTEELKLMSSEAGVFVSDESGNQYNAIDITTDDFRGYHLQEKLLELINNGVLEIRRPTYLDAAKKFCEGIMVFQKKAYPLNDSDKSVPGVAARALEILKELHHLGILHMYAGDSFFSMHGKEDSSWTSEDINSLRLGDFSSAEFYINTDTGDLIAGKSPAEDLRAFAETFFPEAERENFLKAIDGKFNYDHWISHFKKLQNSDP